jgi:hypothetical protein
MKAEKLVINGERWSIVINGKEHTGTVWGTEIHFDVPGYEEEITEYIAQHFAGEPFGGWDGHDYEGY